MNIEGTFFRIGVAMKSKVLIFLTALLLVVLQPLAGQDETLVLTEQFTDHIFLLEVTTFFPVNTVASIGPDGILLVDPGMDLSYDGLMKELSRLTDSEVKIVIHTHSHAHHMSMSKLLGESAEVIAHSAAEGLMRSDLDVLLEWPEAAFADMAVNADTSIFFNGEEIRLLPMAGAHVNDDILVHFTNSKVVCSGGVVRGGLYPFIDFTRGGSIQRYPELADKALEAIPQDVTFVPAHGQPFSHEDGQDYAQRLKQSIKLIKNGHAQGLDAEEMIGKGVLNELGEEESAFANRDFWIRLVHGGLESGGRVKKNLVAPLFYALEKGDGEDAVQTYAEIKENSPDEYGFNENVLNALGYFLMGKERYEDARAILQLKVEEYPESFNVYDSLGEVYMNMGNYRKARRLYRKSIRINPDNENGRIMLERMAEG